jgi:hypothetical protein
VQTFGNELLARTALTNDQHRPIQMRSAACALYSIKKSP